MKNLGIMGETGEYIDDVRIREAQPLQWGRIRLEKDGTMRDPSRTLGSPEVFWPVAAQAEAFPARRDGRVPGAKRGGRYFTARVVDGRVKLAPVRIAEPASGDLPVDFE